jgi:aconitate decarboxylase
MDAIARFADHVAATRFEALPEAAVAAAETFVLDTIGVGLGGSTGPKASELAELQAVAGDGAAGAHVWSLGRRVGQPAAAMCNAYQVHNAEFDCLHEEAVAHVMSAVVPAAMSEAECAGGIDGRRFIEAVVVGVDVAANLGIASASGLRFFRPATVGAFGAAAAIAKLRGFDAARTVNALSIAYGQLCGTMQAHEEGSMLLAMQMGFNARNAVVACDLAGIGLTGPENVLEGRFGFFALFEDGGDPQAQADTLGKVWRIVELAHKPFPSGRATHGIIDGCLTLSKEYDIALDQIEAVTARVPALVHQLVGRLPREDMDINYARLCARFVAARALLRGTVEFEDFRSEVYRDAETLALANRITVEVADDENPHLLVPVAVEMQLRGGKRHHLKLDEVYGAPGRPMSRESQLEKFRANAAAAIRPMPEAQVEALIGRLSALRDVGDVREIARLLVVS